MFHRLFPAGFLAKLVRCRAGGWPRLARAALLGGLLAGTLLLYFALRARAFSPALAEARLQALTARICPHFLFNSLNAVLSLIRSEPRRAETALEELAEIQQGARTYLSCHERGRLLLIPLPEILYLKADLKYVTARTASREYLLDESLTHLER